MLKRVFRKLMGIKYLVLIVSPFSLPGIHLGISLTTRTASASKRGSTLFKTFTSVPCTTAIPYPMPWRIDSKTSSWTGAILTLTTSPWIFLTVTSSSHSPRTSPSSSPSPRSTSPYKLTATPSVSVTVSYAMQEPSTKPSFYSSQHSTAPSAPLITRKTYWRKQSNSLSSWNRPTTVQTRTSTQELPSYSY